MAGLTDMEELVGTVADKDVAAFLMEALACYGAGAHRACVVLTHIALFDSLRRKVLALAPVNGVAKSVSDEIEALASAQKVFETPLIQKLRSAGILTQLEAQILEQLNGQRNKAAHPSGHAVTAEEARFVFAEAIGKFISMPIRETSYVVDAVLAKLPDGNFFPSSNIGDMRAVLDQELANLDPSAKPFLINKVVQAAVSADATTAGNARNFLLALVSRRDAGDRRLIVRFLLDPKSSDIGFAELFSMFVACDPRLLVDLEVGTKLRVRTLLLKSAETVGVALPYLQLRHPAHVLGSCVAELGEAFVLSEMKDFSDWVMAMTPYSPELLPALAQAPSLLGRLLGNYRDRAASSQWNTSNPLAWALPALDAPLAAASSGEDAFALLVAVKKGAEWKGNGPAALANDAFRTLPALKAKAYAFAMANPSAAATIHSGQHLDVAYATFLSDYLA